jgi:serine/threonine protein kinase
LWEAANVAQNLSHEEIVRATDNFSTIVGKAGFGIVYKGILSNRAVVAGKVLSNTSRQRPQEFINEVKKKFFMIRRRSFSELVRWIAPNPTLVSINHYMIVFVNIFLMVSLNIVIDMIQYINIIVRFVSRWGRDTFGLQVTLLSRVRHMNLVELVGYSIDNNLVLVYEFMPGGSLYDALFGKPIDKSFRSGTATISYVCNDLKDLI